MKSPYELTEKEFESLVHIAEKKYRSRIENYILRRSLAVVYDFLEKYNRIFALFVVLRFAQSHAPGEPDLPRCFQKDDEKAITRALDSLKSQLRAVHKRSGRAGEPARFAYVWARERDTSEHHHYHVVLLFDRDIYGYLGDYTKSVADNMGTRIQKAWCSAIGLDYFDYAYLPHFPKNHSAWFSRSDTLALRPDYHNFLLRLAYLAKEYSKDFHDGNRNFGTS